MSFTRLLPWPVHGTLEYLAGIFLILAPFIFGFRDDVAFPVFIGVGVVIVVLGLLSPEPTGVTDLLPASVHSGIDYILAVFLIITPLVLNFATTPETISILLGVAHLVVSLLTRYPTQAESTADRISPSGDAG